MTNAVFLFDNYIDRGTVAASSTYSATTTDVINVQHPSRARIWRAANAVGTADVDCTLSANETLSITHAAIVDPTNQEYEAGSPATIQLRGWSDAINGASLVYNQTVNLWAEIAAMGVNGFDMVNTAPAPDSLKYRMLWPNPVLVIALGATYTARFWRFTFGGVNTNFQASRLFLSKGFVPAANFSYGYSTEFADLSNPARTISGQEFMNGTRARPQRIRLTFDQMTDGERDLFTLNARLAQQSGPFVCQLKPDAGGAQKMMTSLYARITSAAHVQPFRTSLSLGLSEVW